MYSALTPAIESSPHLLQYTAQRFVETVVLKGAATMLEVLSPGARFSSTSPCCRHKHARVAGC